MGEVAQQQPRKAAVNIGERGMMPTNLEEGFRMAQAISASGVSRDKPEAILIQMQVGFELGIPPMTAVKNIPIIKGKPFIETAMAAALVESKGMLERGTKIVCTFEGEGKDLTATVTSTPRGGQPITSEVVMSELPNANNNALYKSQPKRMLKARAVGFHIRDYYSAATLGLMFAEEAGEVTKGMRDVTPVPTPEQPDPLLAQIEAPTDDGEPTTADDENAEWIEAFDGDGEAA
ncbi:MAG: hypothetical protein AAF216_13780 [Pseudomonadota bacterium]